MSELEAPTLPCPACGVSLRLDPEARQARCRHCGTTSPVPETVRAQARAHRLALETELRRLSFSEAFAKGLSSGTMDRLARVYGIVIALLAGIMTLGIMAPQFGADDVVMYVAIGVFAGGLPLTMGVFFLSLPWAVRRDALAEDAPPPPVIVSGALAAATVQGLCSACGGQVPFVLGAPNARCPYCSTTVLPTGAIHREMERLASFRADLEQARNSRRFVRDQGESKLGRGFGWGLHRMRLFFPLLIGVTLGSSLLRAPPPPPVRAGRRPAPVDTSMQFIGASVLGGGVLITLVLVTGSALLGRRRRRSHLDRLAQIYGARVRPDGTRAGIEWLDAHWAATAPEGSLVVQNSDDGQPVERVATDVSHRGVPVLLMLAHAPHVRRFDAFLAGHDRSRVERAPSAAANELRTAGLTVRLDVAGVHLAYPSSDGRFCEPGAAAWMLDRATTLLRGQS